jgi:hypothetical protein
MTRSFRMLKSMVDKFKVIINFERREEMEAEEDMKIYPPPQRIRPPRPGDSDYGLEESNTMVAKFKRRVIMDNIKVSRELLN